MKANSIKGFTLVEIMVAMGLGILMLAVIYGVVNMVQRQSSGIQGKVTAQQDQKAALNLMEMEIRMASFNPTFKENIWVDRNNCFSTADNPPDFMQAYRGIQEATANSITIEMDINESGTVGDAANEIIRYNYDAANLYITRQTNCAGVSQPFLGDTVAGQKTVRVINNTIVTGGLSVFRYFDGSGAEIAAANLPGMIPSIRRIDITLAVETENVDPNSNKRRQMIYSSSVIPRNHAPN